MNGDLAYVDKLGNNTAVSGTASTARKEISGDVNVKRPKGRTIQKERQELNHDFLSKKGLKFLNQSIRKYLRIMKEIEWL